VYRMPRLADQLGQHRRRTFECYQCRWRQQRDQSDVGGAKKARRFRRTLVSYFSFFEPLAGGLSIRPLRLGLDAFVFGWTFLVFPLDSFTS
jgi:hypothetical protein